MSENLSDSKLSVAELVKLCAVDNGLYERTFFSKTVRQSTPLFHREIDEALYSDQRFVSIKVFRGGAKTTKLRLYASKKIAYGIAHTILFVSRTQDHASKSIEWLKRAVEFNKLWANVYGLRPGAKWTGTDIEIVHGVDEYPIRVFAVGITGQVRGFNIDDYRPDLIIVDDADDEETTGTAEQLAKTSDLFFGALAKSLAPESEAPHAKMVHLQTPLTQGDLCDVASKDPQWLSLTFGCFDSNGESRWPERFSTKTLQNDKAAHIKRGQLALWMREMECEIVPKGGTSFVPENIRYWDVLPDAATYIITIDPASSANKSADDQVVMLSALWGSKIFVVDYTAEKGEMPEAVFITIQQWARRYQILGIWAESVSYQRVLAHLLENEMRRTRLFIPVHQYADRRQKSDRIIQTVGAATGYGLLYVRETHKKLLEQYYKYAPTYKGHDDVIDALSIALDVSKELGLGETIEGEYTVEYERPRKALTFRNCP